MIHKENDHSCTRSSINMSTLTTVIINTLQLLMCVVCLRVSCLQPGHPGDGQCSGHWFTSDDHWPMVKRNDHFDMSRCEMVMAILWPRMQPTAYVEQRNDWQWLAVGVLIIIPAWLNVVKILGVLIILHAV